MILEKVSLKQSREHWLRIPYGVERRVRVELKSVKIIMVYNLCFHFNSNNLFIFYIYLISVLKLVLFLNKTYKFYREFNVELHGTDDDR